MHSQPTAPRSWSTLRDGKVARIAAVRAFTRGKLQDRGAIVAALEALIRPHDRVALEGNNQKQADFLSRPLVILAANWVITPLQLPLGLHLTPGKPHASQRLLET